MDYKCSTIRLYTSQAKPVVEALYRDGVCFSKREYVKRKYQETAQIFTTTYDFYVSEAINYVPKPDEAEYPYWAFTEAYNVDTSGNGDIITLEVPIEDVVFFDMFDFTKMLRMKYIGENEEDEANYKELLENYGIKKETDIMLTGFHPVLKNQVLESWKRLFKNHISIRNGTNVDVKSVQVGLWQIKKEWIVTEH